MGWLWCKRAYVQRFYEQYRRFFGRVCAFGRRKLIAGIYPYHDTYDMADVRILFRRGRNGAVHQPNAFTDVIWRRRVERADDLWIFPLQGSGARGIDFHG